MSVSSATVSITAVAAGTATVTVTATDPGGLSATQTISVTVVQPNRAPAAVGTISAQTVNMGGSATTVDVSSNFSDADGDTLTYTSSSDTAKATVSVSSATVSITAVAGGTATITVTATDPGNLTATQTFSVTVNRAPVTTTTMPNQTVTVGGTPATINAGNYFSDPDGDTLSYAYDASQSDIGVTMISIANGITITSSQTGTIRLTVTATDPGGLTATQSCTITVEAANTTPTTNGTMPNETLRVGGSVYDPDVSSYFSDPDGDTLTYTASSSDTTKATVSVSGAIVTVTAVAAGTATITVTATDPGNSTATQTFTLTVLPNNTSPGQALIPTQTVNTGGTTTLNLASYFSDPDGDTLTYTASSSDTSKATVSLSSATLTITGVTGGGASITVAASDGELSASQTVSVTVSPQQADAVPGLSSQELSLLKGLFTYDTLIINELHNGAVDTTDWLEIRNVSDVDISLNTWQLTIRTGEVPVVITFPADTVIPAGEVLLLVNTGASVPDLTGVSIMSVVSEIFVLPQQGFSLILRSPAMFGDLVSNYAVGEVERPEALPPLTAGVVWDRSQLDAPGYLAEAWTASTSADGLGTPGYQAERAASVDLNGDGVVNILDLVLVANQIGQPAVNNIADVNGDSVVNILDLVLVASEL